MKRLVLTLLCVSIVACFSLSVTADDAVKEKAVKEKKVDKKVEKVEQKQKEVAKKDGNKKEDRKDAKKEDVKKKDEAVKKKEAAKKEKQESKKEDVKKQDAKKDATKKDPAKKDAKKKDPPKKDPPKKAPTKKEAEKKDPPKKDVKKEAKKSAPKKDAAKDAAKKCDAKKDVKKDAKKAAPKDKAKKAKDAKPEKKEAEKKEAEKKETKKDEPKKDEAKKDEAKKEDAKEEPKEEKEELKTIEVKKDEVHLCVDLKGVFEARKATPIKLDPQQWSSYKVLRAAKHGQQVERGDLLVAFDPEKIDKAITDGRRELALARLNYQKTQKEYATFKKLLPTNQKIIDRAAKELHEDQAWEDSHDRKMVEADLEMFFKIAKFRVDNAREEYKQLKKLYEADDLTEETEEIILKRTKLQLEQAEYMFKYFKSQYDFAKKYGLERFRKTYEEGKLREKLSTEERIALFPLTVELQKIAMEKERIAFERLQEKFKELQEDRKLMTIKAPCDGVVYYGYCNKGKWGGASSDMFDKGKSVTPKKPFMTIVRTDSLQVRSSVSEKDLPMVREGLKATARATVMPETQLQLLVDHVADVPSGSSFDVVLKLIGKTPEQLMPGMSCAIRAIGYHKKDALVIPPKAIETDPLDDAKHFVYRVGKDGKPKKVKIRKGKTFGKNVEILGGLKAGDKILPEPPEEEDK